MNWIADPQKHHPQRPGLAAVVVLIVLFAGASPVVVAQTTSPKGSLTGPMAFPEQGGEALYRAVCQGCHMPNGQGASGAGAYPALAGNVHLEASGYPVLMVLNGHGAMPSFANALTDLQIADVVTYVRSHFGNTYADPVTPAAVKAARGGS
jgi:mono/diheme cytochrome c family protein